MIFEELFFIFKDSIIFLNKIKVCPLFSVFSKKIRSVPVVPVVKNKNKVCPHCKKNRGHTSLHSNKNRDRPCRTALLAKMHKMKKYTKFISSFFSKVIKMDFTNLKKIV